MAQVQYSWRGRRAGRSVAFGGSGVVVVLGGILRVAQAQPADLATSPPPAASPTAVAMEPKRTYSDAIFVDAAVGFVPYVNDVLPMVGFGVRIARIHELWARAGYFVAGDDRQYGYGGGGYRVALRPGKRVRPLLGGMIAAVPEIGSHNAAGQRVNVPQPLFAVAATIGLRLEPVPWLGLGPMLAIGIDSTVHPIGMVELAVSVALPQTLDGGRAPSH